MSEAAKAPAVRKIHCTIMRGGTSKGIFFRAADLPVEAAERDRVLLRIFGSPDPRQIDGLGGAVTATSKAAILAPASKPGADIDYTFGQVEINAPDIDYAGICGNLSAAVAAFAVEEGFVAAQAPKTVVNIHQTNSGRLIRAEVPVENGLVQESGDFVIDGVPGSGARITLDFADVVGSNTGHLFPTGAPRDRIHVPDLGSIDVTILDVANVIVVIPAEALGASPSKGIVELESDAQFMSKFDLIRRIAAGRAGITSITNSFPLAVAVGPATSYVSFLSGAPVPSQSMDLWALEWVNHKLHRTFSGTASVGTAVAASIPGSVAHHLVGSRNGHASVRIGHPSGTIAPEAIMNADCTRVIRAAVGRTARRIMEGVVRIPLI